MGHIMIRTYNDYPALSQGNYRHKYSRYLLSILSLILASLYYFLEKREKMDGMLHPMREGNLNIQLGVRPIQGEQYMGKLKGCY